MYLNPDRNYEALFLILYSLFVFPPAMLYLFWRFQWKLPDNPGIRHPFMILIWIVPYGLLRGIAYVVQALV